MAFGADSTAIKNLPATRLRSATAAANTSPITAKIAMNNCSISKESLAGFATKGPKPCRVPQMENPDKMKMIDAVSRPPYRNAAKKGNELRETHPAPADRVIGDPQDQ